MIELLRPSAEILSINESEAFVERVGRVNYQREEREPKTFTKMILDRGHHTLLEFNYIIAHIICDRGVSHELVRHRLASFNQESTRYVDYRKCMPFIIPLDVDLNPVDPTPLAAIRVQSQSLEESYERDWMMRRIRNYESYLTDINVWKKNPEEARNDLPMCLKTELFLGANLREWMHIFALRLSPAAHPEMRRVMEPLHKELSAVFPTVLGGRP